MIQTVDRFDGFEQWRGSDGRQYTGAEALDPDARQRWLETVVASPALLSLLLDADGVVLDGSVAAVEGCGFQRSEIVGLPFWEAGWWRPDPTLASRARRWCQQAVYAADALAATTRFFRADGSIGMLDLNMAAVDLGAGAAARHLVVTALDVTDALSARAGRENAIAAGAVASRQAEARLRAGLDAMLDNVTIARAVRGDDNRIVDFVIEFANLASTDGAGRSGAELVGGLVRELYPAWQSSGMFDRFVEVVETGVPFIEHRMAYHDVLADGTPIEGFWALQVTKLDDGYIAASRNITEAVRHEEAARAAELNAVRERLATEVLQGAALSLDVPVVAGIDIGVHYQPAAGPLPIGGDWYDAIELADRRVAFIIADVAGHGPDAAAYMVQVRNILRALVLEHPEPRAVLSRADRTVRALMARQRSFATCCIAMLDPSTGALRWSSAGHPPPIVVGADGRVRFLHAPPGPPLGVAGDAHYHQGDVSMSKGDRLVLYTDGLVETRNAPIDDDLDRLAVAAPGVAHLGASDAAVALATTLSPGTDDVALIVVDLRAASGVDQPPP